MLDLGLADGAMVSFAFRAHQDLTTYAGSLHSMTIEATGGAQDIAFAEAVSLDFIALDTALPPVRVAEASADGTSPWTVPGDSSIDHK